jgi:hypothetical protein
VLQLSGWLTGWLAVCFCRCQINPVESTKTVNMEGQQFTEQQLLGLPYQEVVGVARQCNVLSDGKRTRRALIDRILQLEPTPELDIDLDLDVNQIELEPAEPAEPVEPAELAELAEQAEQADTTINPEQQDQQDQQVDKPDQATAQSMPPPAVPALIPKSKQKEVLDPLDDADFELPVGSVVSTPFETPRDSMSSSPAETSEEMDSPPLSPVSSPDDFDDFDDFQDAKDNIAGAAGETQDTNQDASQDTEDPDAGAETNPAPRECKQLCCFDEEIIVGRVVWHKHLQKEFIVKRVVKDALQRQLLEVVPEDQPFLSRYTVFRSYNCQHIFKFEEDLHWSARLDHQVAAQ